MKLSELVDIEELRKLCECFTKLHRSVTAILDLEGNILVATGWQDICTCFHRVNPSTASRCLESDTILAGQLMQGQQYNVYKCKNGLVDVAVPIIIEGEHIANFFTGQFFFEPPNKEFFIRQAEEFGFDKDSYINALNKVPIFSEDQIRALMEFFTHLTQMISKMGLANKLLHESQKQLEKLNDSLEQRISMAAAELRDKDRLMLLQSRQAAMGEMINYIAHQLKQPLNNLALETQAMTYAFKAGELTQEIMESGSDGCLDLIQFMSNTIDDFTHFFRSDHAKESFSIRQSTQRVLRLLSASMKDNNINIFVEPGDDVYATGYPNEYAQVLLNLLGNARDVFIERSIVAPKIRIRFFSNSDGAVVVISDNGGGISHKIINDIFNPYFTTKEAGKGSGIGLSMSKIIIEQHMGGSLTAENFVDGVQFRIAVPKGAETTEETQRGQGNTFHKI